MHSLSNPPVTVTTLRLSPDTKAALVAEALATGKSINSVAELILAGVLLGGNR